MNLMERMMGMMMGRMSKKDKEAMMDGMMEEMDMKEMMPKMMMGMMGCEEGEGGMMGMMSGMQAGDKEGGMSMMPQCLTMMLPKLPKEKRVEVASKMVNLLIEKSSVGMSEDEKTGYREMLAGKIHG